MLIAAVAAVFLFTRPALAVNLHNGAIVVHNNTSDVIQVLFAHGWSTGRVMQKANLAPGKTLITDVCCFAAGSPYEVSTYRFAHAPVGGHLPDLRFTPHLCNRDGIPYGYAVIVVNDNNTIHEIDKTSCYEVPH